MSLRIKLFVLPALAIAAAAAFIAVASERYVRHNFEQAQQQRRETLIAQFRADTAQRGKEVTSVIQSVADAEATVRMALDLSRPKGDPSLYSNDARGLANTYHLDFLELATADGTVISSAQWPGRSGYANDWAADESDLSNKGAFLTRVHLPAGVDLGLLAVRAVGVGDYHLYVIGGRRFDRDSLQTLALPDGTRALLYSDLKADFTPTALDGPQGPAVDADQLAPLVKSVLLGRADPQPQTMQLSGLSQADVPEMFSAVPLLGRQNEILGAVLVGNSQKDLLAQVQYIRELAFLAGGAGLLFSLLLSWWVSARVSRPLKRITDAAREIQAGKWHAGAAALPAHSGSETGKLASALGEMVGQLARDRERLVQRERAAARREMARRFTRELKESLFPLHMAAEDLLDAREETSERFDEIFFDSMASLRAELGRLRNVAARFGDFARMGTPQLVPVSVNEAARSAMLLIEPQFRLSQRPPVTPEVHLAEPDPVIVADADLLRTAVKNVLLDCLISMTAGGTLIVRTGEKDGIARIEVSASGVSFKPEECSRFFTPAGCDGDETAGLGLVTAQAIVTDLGGRLSAESSPNATITTFCVEFPTAPMGVRPLPAPAHAAAGASSLRLTTGKRLLSAAVQPSSESQPAQSSEAEREVEHLAEPLVPRIFGGD
jgi:signal transduction histidine kinase